MAFDAYVDRFADGCLKAKWKASHEYAKSLLVTYAVPILRDKPLPHIKPKDIRAVLAPVKDKLATAHNLFSVIRRLFRWAGNEGDLEVSPIDGMEPPEAPATRDVVLKDEELAVVWRASAALGYSQAHGQVSRRAANMPLKCSYAKVPGTLGGEGRGQGSKGRSGNLPPQRPWLTSR